MQRKLRMIACIIGLCAGQLWSPRATLASIRNVGLRQHIATHRALLRLSIHLGAVESRKLVSMICGITLEHYPVIGVMEELVKYAAEWAAPPHSMTPRQIATNCHRMVRSLVDAREIAGRMHHARQ